MTELKNEVETVRKEYQVLPPTDKVLFKSMMEMAFVLLKTMQETQKINQNEVKQNA